MLIFIFISLDSLVAELPLDMIYACNLDCALRFQSNFVDFCGKYTKYFKNATDNECGKLAV